MFKKMSYFILLFFVFVPNINAEDILSRIDFYGDINNMIDKSDVRTIQVTYTSDDIKFDAYATLKLQGDSSLAYDKKNYNITFYEDDKLESKKKVNLRWGDISKYTLKANWIDSTHSRNIVSGRIAAQMQKKYNLFPETINNGLVDGFPVQVFVNNEFLGLYTLNLHKDSIFDFDNDDVVVWGAVRHSTVTKFRTYATDFENDFELEVGEETQENLDNLNRLLTFVSNSSKEEFINDFEKYFNLDSVLNYYCFMRFALLDDNTDNNIMLVTYDGEIWYLALYDLDSSWGIDWHGHTFDDYQSSMIFRRGESALWSKFEECFADYIVVRYNELREDILTEENVMNEFNKFYSLIPNDILLQEQNKWSLPSTYDLTQIQDFLNFRIDSLDQSINKMKTDNYDKVYASFALKNKEVKNEIEHKVKDKSPSLVICIIIVTIGIILAGVILVIVNKHHRKKV